MKRNKLIIPCLGGVKHFQEDFLGNAGGRG
jgi:hypothetical protein